MGGRVTGRRRLVDPQQPRHPPPPRPSPKPFPPAALYPTERSDEPQPKMGSLLSSVGQFDDGSTGQGAEQEPTEQGRRGSGGTRGLWFPRRRSGGPGRGETISPRFPPGPPFLPSSLIRAGARNAADGPTGKSACTSDPHGVAGSALSEGTRAEEQPRRAPEPIAEHLDDGLQQLDRHGGMVALEEVKACRMQDHQRTLVDRTD